MLITHLRIFAQLAMVTVCAGCVYPFEPKGYNEINNLLVVEGDIIANGTTVVKLSRSVKLSSEEKNLPVERYAGVQVESSKGVVYSARETAAGVYEAATMNLDLSALYRLHITTRNGMRYASEYIPVSTSSIIDSIYYSIDEKERCVNIYVSAHNPVGNTRFYRWSCEQDWEFTSDYRATITYNTTGGMYTGFPVGYDIFTCWKKETYGSLVIDDTSTQSQDLIVDKKVLTIHAGDVRLSYLYSVTVVQRGLTPEAFSYWNTLFKNSETMGSVFSSMPSEYRGNITCLTQPDQIVLGYINATTLSTSKRLFIEKPFHTKASCLGDDLKAFSMADRTTANRLLVEGYLPLNEGPDNTVVWAPNRCVDCTIRGTKNKPSWWPNDH